MAGEGKEKVENDGIHRVEYPDSVEVGSASKGGVLKVYFNADRKAEAIERVRIAREVLEAAGGTPIATDALKNAIDKKAKED